MKYLAFFFVVITVFVSCRKKQPEMNSAQNACDCQTPVTASFKMFELFNLAVNALKTETDTAYIRRRIQFEADQDGNEYEWRIRGLTIRVQDINLYFSEDFAGQDVPITLIARRKVNNICSPNDDGVDSLTKILHFVYYDYNAFGYARFNLPWRMEGSYKMKNTLDPLSDSLVLGFDMYGQANPNRRGVKVINLYGTGDTIEYYPPGFEFNFRGFKFPSGEIKGTLLESPDGSYVFDYINEANPSQKFLYKGRKL